MIASKMHRRCGEKKGSFWSAAKSKTLLCLFSSNMAMEVPHEEENRPANKTVIVFQSQGFLSLLEGIVPRHFGRSSLLEMFIQFGCSISLPLGGDKTPNHHEIDGNRHVFF